MTYENQEYELFARSEAIVFQKKKKLQILKHKIAIAKLEENYEELEKLKKEAALVTEELINAQESFAQVEEMT